MKFYLDKHNQTDLFTCCPRLLLHQNGRAQYVQQTVWTHKPKIFTSWNSGNPHIEAPTSTWFLCLTQLSKTYTCMWMYVYVTDRWLGSDNQFYISKMETLTMITTLTRGLPQLSLLYNFRQSLGCDMNGGLFLIWRVSFFNSYHPVSSTVLLLWPGTSLWLFKSFGNPTDQEKQKARAEQSHCYWIGLTYPYNSLGHCTRESCFQTLEFYHWIDRSAEGNVSWILSCHLTPSHVHSESSG